MTTTNNAVEMCRRIVGNSDAAQEEILRMIDKIRAMPWAQHDEVAPDIVAQSEAAFCKLSTMITRMSLDAKSAIPDFGPDGCDDELVEPDTPTWPEE